MALNTAALNSLAGSFATLAPFIALHTANPGATGTAPASSARVAATWGAAAAGAVTATNKAFTGGAANGPVTHVGFWSDATAGTFYGSQALTGDATFNSAGEYTITSVSQTAS